MHSTTRAPEVRHESHHDLRVKDVTLGEDRSLVHVGAGPTILALLREAALNLLRRTGCRTIARRLRAHADRPLATVALVVGPPGPTGA